MENDMSKIIAENATFSAMTQIIETFYECLRATSAEDAMGILEESRELATFEHPILNILDTPLRDPHLITPHGDEIAASIAGLVDVSRSQLAQAQAVRHFASASLSMLRDIACGLRPLEDYLESPLRNHIQEREHGDHDPMKRVLEKLTECESVIEACDVVMGVMSLDQLSGRALNAVMPADFAIDDKARAMACLMAIDSYFDDIELSFAQANYDAEGEEGLLSAFQFFQVEQIREDIYWYQAFEAGAIPGFYSALSRYLGDSSLNGFLTPEWDALNSRPQAGGNTKHHKRQGYRQPDVGAIEQKGQS